MVAAAVGVMVVVAAVALFALLVAVVLAAAAVVAALAVVALTVAALAVEALAAMVMAVPAGIELANRARVPNDTNFQVFKFKFHMASLQKKALVLSDFLLFQCFKKKINAKIFAAPSARYYSPEKRD